VGKKHSSRGSATPPTFQGGGPQRPQNYGTPNYAEIARLTATKFGMVTAE